MPQWMMTISYQAFETFLGLAQALEGYTLRITTPKEIEGFDALLVEVYWKEDSEGLWVRRKLSENPMLFAENPELIPIKQIVRINVY